MTPLLLQLRVEKAQHTQWRSLMSLLAKLGKTWTDISNVFLFLKRLNLSLYIIKWRQERELKAIFLYFADHFSSREHGSELFCTFKWNDELSVNPFTYE